MDRPIYNTSQRMTRAQKEANQKEWFREKIDSLGGTSSDAGGFSFDPSTYRSMKTNYDLFNNIINISDFEKVIFPLGKDVGSLPADFTNKDIISSKVKALLGMEMKRPFSWKIVAINEEASTRKEMEQTKRLKDFVVSTIMTPIKTSLEQKYIEETKGIKMTPEQQEELKGRMEEELKTLTPPEVRKYMQRDHQDPAEALGSQLLEYMIEKEEVRFKFNKAWKHATIAGREFFWVGIINGEPLLRVVNPMRFKCDRSTETDFVEEGDWATYESFMTPSEIVRYFGSELTPTEIDEVIEDYNNYSGLESVDFAFSGAENSLSGIRVRHAEWKALKPLKFLRGLNLETGEGTYLIVDEAYKLNREAGDISIETEWIPTRYEGYKIGADKYAFLREVPGQHKDITNLYDCKLSYMGAIYDNLNSQATSLVDRMKYYQYLYNVVAYRMELLMASDEGKKLLINANLIPKHSGVDIKEWMYMFKVNNIGILDPSEEGNKGNQNMGEAAKEIDMSLISDIQKYQMLLEYIDRRCGESVGINKQVEGQIGEGEAVRNTEQALIKSANILEPYFEIHNMVKRNVLQSLVEVSKVAYSELQPKALSYVLDDMSLRMLSPDYELLENSTYGVFVSNSIKSDEALQMVKQLSHAALQNQKIELSDVIKIMNSNSLQQAQELLELSEKDRVEREGAMEQNRIASAEKLAKEAREFEMNKIQTMHQNKMAEISLEGEIDLKKQAILAMGFNEDKDTNDNQILDVLEVAKFERDSELKGRKQTLEERKLEQQKKEHRENLEVKRAQNNKKK